MDSLGDSISPPEDSDWLELGERVLWHGRPLVDHRFRVRMWGRGLVLFVAVAIAGPLLLDGYLGFDLPFFIAGAAIMGVWTVTYVPHYCRKLARTQYVLTSQRAVVTESAGDGRKSVTWSPLDGSKVKVKRRRGGSTTVVWGRSEGRVGSKASPAVQVARGLGFMDREDKDVVLFAEVEQPAPLLSAIRGGRAALGLPPGV